MLLRERLGQATAALAARQRRLVLDLTSSIYPVEPVSPAVAAAVDIGAALAGSGFVSSAASVAAVRGPGGARAVTAAGGLITGATLPASPLVSTSGRGMATSPGSLAPLGSVSSLGLPSGSLGMGSLDAPPKAAPTGPVRFAIRRIVLPVLSAALANMDDEEMSTAFGHTAHVLTLIAKYLHVPLRYRLLCTGSRSSIVNDVTSIEYPLYANGVDRERFECACYLLNLDIRQLLIAQRVSTVAGFHATLENLDALLVAILPR